MPNARKITKTDLAKYLNAWDEEPHVVSLGAQKNFEKFMEKLASHNGQEDAALPDVPAYKSMIARAILFKTAQSVIRPRFQAFQANITNYVVSLVATGWVRVSTLTESGCSRASHRNSSGRSRPGLLRSTRCSTGRLRGGWCPSGRRNQNAGTLS